MITTILMKRLFHMTVFLFLVSLLPAQELLNIDRALEIAMQNSPNMQQTALSLESSRESLNAQRARLKSQFSLGLTPFEYSKRNRFDPTRSEWFLNEGYTSSGTFAIEQKVLPTDGVLKLSNTFGYQYNYSSSVSATESPESKVFDNKLQLELVQPLFTYNRTKVELEEVELEYERSLLSYLLQKLSLEKSVKTNFFEVYSRQMQLNIDKEEQKNNEESYEIIKNKVEGGLLAVEELYQAEVNLATSRSSVYSSELNLQNSLDNFKVLIGMEITEELLIMADIEVDSVGIDEDIAIEHALANRMELRQKQILIEKSLFSLQDAKTTNEFAGSVSAAFGLQGTNEQMDLLFNNPTQTPSIGVTFSIPIFDWGERKSRIKAAEANLKSTEIDLEVEKIDIVKNVRQVMRSITNLENQIDIQRKSVKNAELTYNINLERYRNGDLTSLDLGIYQDQLSSKKLELTQAIINYKLELLELKIQTLYDFENQVSIIPDEIKAN